MKVLLQLGHLSAKDANDQVTRLLNRGVYFEKENNLNEVLTNYKVANLLLKEFSTETDVKLLLRCLKCFEHVYLAMGNEKEAKRYNRGVANLKKKLSKKAKVQKVDDTVSVVQSQQPQN